MKILISICLFVVSSVLQAASFSDIVYDSVSILGVTVEEAQRSLPSLCIDSSLNVGRFAVTADGMQYDGSIVIEEGRVVGVTWRPHGQMAGSTIAASYYNAYRKFLSCGYRSIIESTSISGQVIAGGVVEHSRQGVSVIACLVDYRLKLRVEMKFESEPSLTSSAFLISISGDEPAPASSNDRIK